MPNKLDEDIASDDNITPSNICSMCVRDSFFTSSIQSQSFQAFTGNEKK